ncbi:MAG: MATE family efflux transporter [Bacillota bacterium]|nr:MATE family efflux transporter [Bacillota bacterium]
MDNKIVKDNSLVKETLKIAWPAIVESVFIVIVGMVDTYMVSPLGKVAIASISLANQPKILIYIIFFAANVAISALIARRKGGDKRQEAHELFMTGMVYTVVAGIILTFVCVVFAEPIIVIFGGNEETTDITVMYFRIIMGGMLTNLIMMYINSSLRGCGNTKITLQTNVVGNIINIFCNYLLIEGHLGFPALGVAGAGIATVIGQTVASIMCIVAICRGKSYIQYKFIKENKIRPTKDAGMALLKMGGNITTEMLLTRIGFALTSMITVRIGTDPYAAHAVGMHFMNLGFAFGDGMQMAAVSLIGMSLGAKDKLKAKKIGVIAQKTGLIISVIMVAILLVFGRILYGLYFDQDYMLDMCMMINLFIAVIMPIQISKIIFNGVLRGAGDVKYTLYASAFSVTLVQPIVSYLLVMILGLGLKGVWLSILVTQAVQFFCFALRYKSGKWTEKEI